MVSRVVFFIFGVFHATVLSCNFIINICGNTLQNWKPVWGDGKNGPLLINNLF